MAAELIFITGATGFVGSAVLLQALEKGYRVRASVRRESQIKDIKNHALIAPFAEKLSFVVVPDITADGAFDAALDGVTYIQHVASPLPSPTMDPEKDIIIPAIRGTTSILNSALKTPSIHRIVITSSVVAVIPDWALSNGDSETVYTPDSRLRPLPTAPFGNHISAYRSAKALALDATDRFLIEKKPHFTVVNVMPGYILGANYLNTKAEHVGQGTNALIIGMVLGSKSPITRPCTVIDVRDVARVQLEALDEEKVKGSASFLLDAERITFDDAIDIVKRNFPGAVKSGVLPLGGSIPAAYQNIDASETLRVFGKLRGYEDMVNSVVEQYVTLKSKDNA